MSGRLAWRWLGLFVVTAGCASEPASPRSGDPPAQDPGSATPAPAGDSGSAAGDAGTGVDADGATDGGASDAPTVTPCPGPFVFCEDFENGVDGGTWKVTGAPTIDATRVHAGAHALHFSDAAQLRTTAPFPKLQNDMWGRVFVYMVQTPPGSTTSNLGPNASFAASGGGGGLYRFGFRHTRFSAGWNYPGFDQTNTDDLVWPLDQWVCVEWHHASDPTTGNGTQDYWMNGDPRPKMHFDAHPMPPFSYFWIAEYLFGSPYEMWMDDLALDTSQIGCAR